VADGGAAVVYQWLEMVIEIHKGGREREREVKRVETEKET
jgi:hypothetical protein